MEKVTPLEEMTLNDLKNELTKLGFKGAEVFNSKAQAINVLTSMRTKPADAEQVAVPIVPVETPAEVKKDELSYQSKADRMKEKLDAQEKVRIFLPLEPKEQPGSVREVIVDGKRQVETSGAVEKITINGYSTFIPKGVPTQVPLQIAEVVGQGQDATAKAGLHIDINRPDTEHPDTPYRTVNEALSK